MTDETEQTEKKKFKGEAEAMDEEKAEVGGKKCLIISNVLFQADLDCETKADALLARLKDRKKYNEITTEFCPVPIERGDTVAVEEFVTNDKSIWHLGLIRQVKLSVTPTSQILTMILED